MKNNSVRNLTMTALLVGLGIVIPMVMPIKLVIGPASFTLASHVPVLIAMFFSVPMAVAVALGTAFGFLLNLGPVIALRALSHLVFAVIGAWYLQKNPQTVTFKGQFTLLNPKFQLFNIVIGLIHAAVEVLAVLAFNFVDTGSAGSYPGGAFYFFFVLMGVGGFIHSLVDYNIAYFLAATLAKHFDIPVFTAAKKLASKEELTNKNLTAA